MTDALTYDDDGASKRTCLLAGGGLLAVLILAVLIAGGGAAVSGESAAVGGAHSCAVLDTGNVHCWGDDSSGQAADYWGGDAVDVTAGGSHSCALLEGGHVTCWGKNATGQTEDQRVNHVADAFNTGSIDAGAWETSGAVEDDGCGYTSPSSALRFDGSGDRRVTTAEGVSVPNGAWVTFSIRLGTGASPCQDVDAGDGVVLEYSTDDGASWSELSAFDPGGEYDAWTSVNVTLPQAAHSSSTLLRWSQPSHSGDGQDNWAIDDVEVSAWKARQVSAGWDHTCAVLQTGQVNCWGDDADGEASPVLLEDGFNTGSIDASKWETSGMSEDDGCGYVSSPSALRFAGSGTRSVATQNPMSFLGGGVIEFYIKAGIGSDPCEAVDSSSEDVVLEYSIDGGGSWTQFAYFDHNDYGSWTHVEVPVPAEAQTDQTHVRWIQLDHSGSCCDHWAIEDVTTWEGSVEQVSAGNDHTCALHASGNVSCWGLNDEGQANDYHGEDALATSAGGDHSCALLTTGDVHCWGDNTNGQASDYNGSDATAITTGWKHTCALLTTGDVHCWGDDTQGQASDYNGGDATAITAGAAHTCALLTTGEAHCWGDDTDGQALDHPHPPTAPTALGAEPGPGAGEITLNWTPPSQDAWADPMTNAYTVYRSNDAGGPYSLAGEVGDVSSFSDAGLDDNATYHYVVSASNDAGEGPQSEEAQATTHAPPSPPVNVAAEPGSGAGEIVVSWDPPVDDGGLPVTNYTIYRSTESGGTFSLVGEVGDVPSFSDAGLDDNATYHYVVSASNDVGEGPQSEEDQATTHAPPSPPVNVAADPGSGAGEIVVSWDSPVDDGGLPVTNYTIYRSTESGGTFSLVETIGDETSFVDEGLTKNTMYHYRVTATNDVEEGPQSEEAQATTHTLPSPPENLSAEAGPSPGNVTLDWEPPADDGGVAVTNYTIYRSAESGGPFDVIAQVGAGETVYVDGGLEDDQTYWYRVSATTEVGEGNATAPESVRTSAVEEFFRDVPEVEVPLAGPHVATVTVRDEDDQVCLDVTVEGGDSQNIACVNRAFLGPAGDLVPRGDVPLLPEESSRVNGTENGLEASLGNSSRVVVSASYVYAPDRQEEIASLLGGDVRVLAPFSPLDDGLTWFLENGEAYPVVVSVSVYDEGERVFVAEHAVPYLGPIVASVGA